MSKLMVVKGGAIWHDNIDTLGQAELLAKDCGGMILEYREVDLNEE